MRIGEAARAVGVEPHVLRHWEDEGVVTPRRGPNGYRDYGDDDLLRLRTVLACQAAGMSLAQVRLVLHHREPGRDDVIRRHQHRVRTQLRELERVDAFLTHVVDCTHSLMTRCPSCSAFARDPSGG